MRNRRERPTPPPVKKYLPLKVDFTRDELDLIRGLRKLDFPKSKQMDFDDEMYGEPLCDLSPDQIRKLTHLWMKVYGHNRNGYNGVHHAFLQSILEHKKMEYLSISKLSNECLFEVYTIAPELFNVDNVTAYYKKHNLLYITISKKVRIKENTKTDSEHREFSFQYEVNKEIKDSGVVFYDETNFVLVVDAENRDKLKEHNIPDLEIIDAIDENKKVIDFGTVTY